MKKFFSLLAILLIIFISNCTRIPENNDPVLGIWTRTQIIDNSSKDTQDPQKEEWIFNDAFLGRYHSFSGTHLDFHTDFSWSENEGIYTITYYGTNIPEAKVLLKKSENSEMLEYENGTVFAIRE